MRAIAEFAMRGRIQAMAVTVIGASTLMFSWASAAVIALVTLRRGVGEGAFLLMWAVLPAGALLVVFGDVGPLGMLIGTLALAALLRWTTSWPLTLLGTIVIGVCTGLAVATLGSAYLDQLVQFLDQAFAEFEKQVSTGENPVQINAPTAVQVAGLLGLMNAITCVLCLVLARWWQAMLYNPGGFRQEFHSLSLPPGITIGLVAGMVLVASLGVDYRPWSALFAVPLSVVGLALVHARAASKQLGAPWLTMFYVLWLVLDFMKVLMVLLAIADSWLHFRQRWAAQNETKDGSE